MKFFFLALAIFSQMAFAEPTFIQKMDGLAAECSITGWRARTEADLASQNYGESSKQYKNLISIAFKEAQTCVDTNKPLGRELYKLEVASFPTIRSQLADMYAAWIGYMDWLGTPRDYSVESDEKARYESARNRLDAEIIAQ